MNRKFALAVALSFLASGPFSVVLDSEASELRRQGVDYHLLAQTRARLKGYKLAAGACNIGVSRCSAAVVERLHATCPELGAGTRVVSDRLSFGGCAGAVAD